MSDENAMIMEELQEKHNISLEKFNSEILQICLKPEYSNDVVRDGLDFALNFVRKEIYKARRMNFVADNGFFEIVEWKKKNHNYKKQKDYKQAKELEKKKLKEDIIKIRYAQKNEVGRL